MTIQKPFPGLQYPKPKRRERRRNVTLIAGLVCSKGIVFAGDSEESGFIRKSVDKVAHNKAGLMGALAKDQTAVVVAGAGNGTLCDYASQKILDELPFKKHRHEIEDAITRILLDIHRDQVPVHPVSDPQEAEIELLVGVRTELWPIPLLYSTQGAAVVRRAKYYVCGSGALTEYVLNQIYQQHMSIEDGVSAVLYMMQLAKAYVPGVGGSSHVYVLNQDGSVDDKPSWEISEEENLAKQFSFLASNLLVSAMRTRTETDADFSARLKSFTAEMKRFRQRKRISDKRWDEWEANLKQTLRKLGDDKDISEGSQ